MILFFFPPSFSDTCSRRKEGMGLERDRRCDVMRIKVKEQAIDGAVE